MAMNDQIVFPGADWVRMTPKEAGLDAAALAAAVEDLRSNVGKNGVDRAAIAYRGRIVFEGAESRVAQGTWSATKSFTSTAMGLLVDDGACTPDTRAADVLPELDEHYPDLRLRHFTAMTSGYRARGDEPNGTYIHGPSATPFEPDRPEFAPPGSAYLYWDSAMNEFAHVLTRIAGERLVDLLRRRVTDIIGMDPAGWTWGEFPAPEGGPAINCGSGNHALHVKINALDLSRFGLLFLAGGEWAGRRLISRKWIDAATSSQVSAGLPMGRDDVPFDGRGRYGFNWWVNGVGRDGTRKWPDAPPRTFAAVGFNNNKCFVVPEWGLVVTRLGLDGNVPDAVWNSFFRLLGRAMKR